MEPEKYKPNFADIAWAKVMLQTIKHGGVMAFPDTFLVYRLDHQLKRVVLQNPSLLNVELSSRIVHERTIETFNVLGYEVLPYIEDTIN